jgi:hypothetical protein
MASIYSHDSGGPTSPALLKKTSFIYSQMASAPFIAVV